MSVFIKKKILMKFINKKDPQITAEFFERHKPYRNLLSTLIKGNTWKGIKIRISVKNITTTILYAI